MVNRLFIPPNKEVLDHDVLIGKIQSDNWINKNVVIINVSPEYSSRLVQSINHKLSYLNGNELFEVINLELPKKNMSQVWDSISGEFRMFDKYLYDWVKTYINSDYKYLFVTSTIYTGKSLNKVKQVLKHKMDLDNVRFASLYLHTDSVIIPNYYHQKFSDYEPLFFWENTKLK